MFRPVDGSVLTWTPIISKDDGNGTNRERYSSIQTDNSRVIIT